ncbi:hypothetical protein Thiosp_01209 [Thiorhodovibrio litoralis]|nr:hypothetical protein Thiosp_01209 [Thiorhodovibrio litoralis]
MTFYRRHSEAWLERYDFCEVGRQLLRLMAFSQRIVKVGGRVEREMTVGRGRTFSLIDENIGRGCSLNTPRRGSFATPGVPRAATVAAPS